MDIEKLNNLYFEFLIQLNSNLFDNNQFHYILMENLQKLFFVQFHFHLHLKLKYQNKIVKLLFVLYM